MSDFQTEHTREILANKFGSRKRFQDLTAYLIIGTLKTARDDMRHLLADVPLGDDDGMPQNEALLAACYAINTAIAHVQSEFPENDLWFGERR